MLDSLLRHGSLAIVFALLFATGFGLPLPEDIVLLSTGALSHRGVFLWPVALLVCMAGILGGDAVLFTTARRLGPAILERPLFRRMLPPERRERAERFVAQRGALAVFIARHVAGLRAPVFVVAAVNGMRLSTFLLWDGLALCISAPAVFGLGWWSSQHLDLARAGLARVEHWALFGAGVALAGYALWAAVRRLRRP